MRFVMGEMHLSMSAWVVMGPVSNIRLLAVSSSPVSVEPEQASGSRW